MKKDQDGFILANVRAAQRPGFTGFARAGVHWPASPEGQTAYLAPDVYAEMKSSPTNNMLFVDTDVDAKGLNLDTLQRVSKPKKYVSDPQAAAAEESLKLVARAEGLQAALDLEANRAKVAELEAKVAAAQAKATTAAGRKLAADVDEPHAIVTHPRK